jgi:hypothetical protein
MNIWMEYTHASTVYNYSSISESGKEYLSGSGNGGTVGDNYLKSKFKVASENTKKCKVGPPNQPTFPANPPTHT